MAAHWFSTNDTQKLLANKKVVIIGDSGMCLPVLSFSIFFNVNRTVYWISRSVMNGFAQQAITQIDRGSEAPTIVTFLSMKKRKSKHLLTIHREFSEFLVKTSDLMLLPVCYKANSWVWLCHFVVILVAKPALLFFPPMLIFYYIHSIILYIQINCYWNKLCISSTISLTGDKIVGLALLLSDYE